MPTLSDLDWQPILLVRVTREPFTGAPCGLQVSRVHMAPHPDGIVCAAWDVPPEQRNFPRVRLVGWKPVRDVPFNPPVRFERKGDPRVPAILSDDTWVLPYDGEQFRLYLRLQQAWHVLMARIEIAPHSPYTLGFVRSLLATTTHSPSLN